MAIEEHTGKIGWIQISEAFDDDVAGLSFVSIAADFLRRQLAGDGDVAVAVIGAASAPCRWLIMGYLIAGLVFV